MPGAMDNNLRRAYLQEELGVYLLRGLAAVASVPRPQDTGIDAIATLLRPDTKRRLYAEESFYIQFKAGSVNSLTYHGAELEWLKGLELPLFIGSVNPTKSSLSLYSCHRAIAQLGQRDYFELQVMLGEGGKTFDQCATESDCPTAPDKKRVEVWLGSPVHEWTPDDMAQPTFLTDGYKMLKAMIDIYRRNLMWQRFGRIEHIEWSTGVPATTMYTSYDCGPMVGIESLPAFGTQDQFDEIIYRLRLPSLFREMLPHIEMLRCLCSNLGPKEDQQAIEPLLKLMRSHGVDPRPLSNTIDLSSDTDSQGEVPSKGPGSEASDCNTPSDS